MSIKVQLLACLCLVAATVNAASQFVFNYNIRTNEEEPVRSLVNVAVAGKLRDNFGDVSGLSYSLLLDDPYIEVDTNSGVIRPKTVLDIEAMCRGTRNEYTECKDGELRHMFTVIVRNRQSNIVARASFTLIVKDINDNSPTFVQTFFTDSRAETMCILVSAACANSRIQLPLARDEDLSQQFNAITYSMENMTNGTAEDFQLINSQTGPPFLSILKGLDAERYNQYEFDLVARDNGNREGRTRYQLMIEDVNDNSPVFTQKSNNITVPENTPRGTTIFTLTATDKDRSHSFAFSMGSISSEISKRHFTVKPDGQVLIASQLDYEATNKFNIHVKVKEGEYEDNAVLNVLVTDVNDNPPHFKEAAPLELEEGSTSGGMVGEILVSDRDSGDNGRVACDTDSQHSNTQLRLKFAPNRDGGQGVYTIYVMSVIDRETDPIVTGTLTCWDFGQPSLTSTFTVSVTIKDRNDNAPVFSQLGPTGVIEAEILENNPPNHRVLQLKASDADQGENARLTFRLAADSEHTDTFAVDRDTGIVTAATVLDRETRDNYQLKVVVTDNGIPDKLSATALVRIRVIDENDNAPRFMGSQDFQVEENKETGALLGRLRATDADLGPNGQIRFLQLNSRHRDLFILDEDGTLRTNAVFDREAKAAYAIQVRAQDLGSPPKAADTEVTISILDVNDQTPKIVSPGNNSQPVRISIYTHRVGSVVMRVQAVDGDAGANGQIVYSLTQQQARNKFSIDQNTGEIRVERPLDMADVNRYKLMVQAKDCAPISPRSEAKVIYIDVDDSAPPVNMLDEAELAAAHTRRNVIIIIILAAVSAVLAIILIVAITCVNRPCCGVYGDVNGAGGGGKRNRHRRPDRVDGAGGSGALVGGGGGGSGMIGGGDLQFTEQAQHLTMTDTAEMAWAGGLAQENLRSATMGSHNPMVTTSFALPINHDAYYGGGGSASNTLPNPRHQMVVGERPNSRGPPQARQGGQGAKSDQVNFWLYQIKEDTAASPQMQHARCYQQQQPQQQQNFCTISRGQHQVVQYGQPQQQQQHHDQPPVDGAQSDSGRGCSDEDLSSGPGYYQPGGGGAPTSVGGRQRDLQQQQQQQQHQTPMRFTPLPSLQSVQNARSTPLNSIQQQQQQQSKPPTPQPLLATIHTASAGHSASPVAMATNTGATCDQQVNPADQVCRQIDSLFFKDV